MDILTLFGLSFLGGLLLNFMPCCLPVISLKLLNLASLERDNLYQHMVAYTSGIMTTFSILASIVIGVKSAGGFILWGFQLQNPLFCLFLALLLLFMGLNSVGLLGWFDRLTLGKSIPFTGKLTNTFLQGGLAVLLGASCTGPFLGVALGAGLAMSFPAIAGMFLAIGAGFASLYLILPLLPGLTVILAKLRKYSANLRIISGIGILLTSAWLFGLAILGLI